MPQTLDITRKMLGEFRGQVQDHHSREDETKTEKRCIHCEVFLEAGIRIVDFLRFHAEAFNEAAKHGIEITEEATSRLREQYEDWWETAQTADKVIRWHLDRNVTIKNLPKYWDARTKVLERINVYQASDVMDEAMKGHLFDGLGIPTN